MLTKTSQVELFQEPIDNGVVKMFPTMVADVSIADETHGQRDVSEAERELLDLADYIYGHTSLKPMSKTLFLISRCLLLARRDVLAESPNDITRAYLELCASLGEDAPIDDFDFAAVVDEVAEHMGHISRALGCVAKLGSATDSLGLAFNTLLRGKFEGGEGLGTYLTPEEVVLPMVEMALAAVNSETLGLISSKKPLYFGDVCGGTGRFVYALYQALLRRNVPRKELALSARLFDQSSLAVGFARLNFLFEDLAPRFESVSDSLSASAVSKLRDSFALLATNPPFGSGKYRWNSGLADSLPPELLRSIGMRSPDDAADPAELFLFRNLDLLAPGGAVAIVLPDGVVQSRDFIQALRIYEQLRHVAVEVMAIVSLPVVTFSLGGTVAKTSFLIIRKELERRNLPLYVAIAEHVGFLKRGNRRLPDPDGNELFDIAREFVGHEGGRGVFVDSWRSVDRFVPAAICHSEATTAPAENIPLRELAGPIRDFIAVPFSKRHFHVSVLDVDETGLINIVAAASNRPVTRALRCRPGDILISCINPNIWRATVVPNVEGAWSCSPEFLALRPRRIEDAWGISLALHNGAVIREAQSLAGGTSSSRQRIEKERLLGLGVPVDHLGGERIKRHAAHRTAYYLIRLNEAQLYDGLHNCLRKIDY
jgi:hypothetical protein